MKGYSGIRDRRGWSRFEKNLWNNFAEIIGHKSRTPWILDKTDARDLNERTYEDK